MPKSKATPKELNEPLGDRDVAHIAGQLLSGATSYWGAWGPDVITKAVALAREVIVEVNRTTPPVLP